MYCNGKEVDWAVMRALNPDRIKSITVLKDKAILEEKYGGKGAKRCFVDYLKGIYRITESVIHLIG